jgi:peptide deformylase
MAMVKIKLYPAKILTEKTPLLEKADKELYGQLEKLKKTLKEGDNAAGLAAPQIGVGKRFFGIKDSDKQVKVYINPKITKTFGDRIFPKLIDEAGKEEDFLEGCLSFPDYFGTVKRFLAIEAEWQELEENKLINKIGVLKNFEAIVFQHELDHLNGVLLIDRIKESKGKLLKVNGKKMQPWSLENFKL